MPDRPDDEFARSLRRTLRQWPSGQAPGFANRSGVVAKLKRRGLTGTRTKKDAAGQCPASANAHLSFRPSAHSVKDGSDRN